MRFQKIEIRGSDGQRGEGESGRKARKVERKISRQAIFSNGGEDVVIQFDGLLMHARRQGRVQTLRKALRDEGFCWNRMKGRWSSLQCLMVYVLAIFFFFFFFFWLNDMLLAFQCALEIKLACSPTLSSLLRKAM